MIDWQAMTEEELAQELERGRVEQNQRAAQARIPEQMEELNREYLASENVQPEQEWRQPSGAHNAYPKGWKVARNGKMWESTTPANVWEPGVSGWIEATPDDPNAPAPEWIIPTGAHDAYRKGAVVTYGGRAWRNEVGANVWTPGTHGWIIVEDDTADPTDPVEPAPEPLPEPEDEIIPQWVTGLSVAVDEQYVYEGITYVVVQAHTTQAGWEPPNLPSLWAEAA